MSDACIKAGPRRLTVAGLLSASVLAAGLWSAVTAEAVTYQSPALRGQPTFTTVVGNGKHKITLSASKDFAPNSRLTVEKGNALASYAVNGLVTTRRMQARFGTLGGVDLRFDPNGRIRRYPVPGCTGGKFTERFGVWEGRLRFRGERGYTSVNRTRVPGSSLSRPAVTCKSPGSPGSLGTILSAYRGNLSFTASKRSKTSRANFGAGREETRGKMTIFRSTSAVGSSATFTYNGPETQATVRPPGAFAGRGAFDANATPSWTGTLRVKLLGAGIVRLTGRGFSASLFSP